MSLKYWTAAKWCSIEVKETDSGSDAVVSDPFPLHAWTVAHASHPYHPGQIHRGLTRSCSWATLAYLANREQPAVQWAIVDMGHSLAPILPFRSSAGPRNSLRRT